MTTSRAWIQSLSIEEFFGPIPLHGLVVGGGVGREEIKAELLARAGQAGRVLSAGAVTSLQDLALGVLDFTKAQLLGPLARQEALRWWMSQAAVAQHLQELKELRRERTFFSKLDHALQTGRMSFSTDDERDVFEGHLESRVDSARTKALRKEIKVIQAVFEAWMQSEALVDPPMLLQQATTKIANATESERKRIFLRLPQTLTWIGTRPREARELLFWETLAQNCTVRTAPVFEGSGLSLKCLVTPYRYERWHSLDDAVEALADQVLAEISHDSAAGGADPLSALSATALVIADRPEVRRSVARVFRERGIPIADPRDPLELRRSEAIKHALLPLSVVSSRYEREEVLAYLGPQLTSLELRAILDQAITRGLSAYSGAAHPALGRVGQELKKLETTLGGRRSLDEVSAAHLSWIADRPESFTSSDQSFWTRFWAEFSADLARLPVAAPRASLVFWMERIQSRLAGTQPPIARAKPAQGIGLFRAGQAPLQSWKRVYFLSIDSDWLESGRAGDFYWSDRDREILSAEFQVRSSTSIRAERTAELSRWIASAEQVTIFEEDYGVGGDERARGATLWAEVFGQSEILAALRTEKSRGAHPRWLSSFSALRSVQPQKIVLGPPRQLEWSASSLDHYTKCAFLGLAQGRWRLDDLKDPDSDLWPEVKGILLHEAAALLLRSRSSDGLFTKSPLECVDEVWRAKPPRGLIRSRRVESTVKDRLRLILEAFAEDERSVYQRASSELVISDDRTLSYELANGVKVIGRPDRIDRYRGDEQAGLFVIDYKTSTDIPTGRDLDERSYRLQLPLYALAAQRKFGEPVLGVQYISLVRKGTRSSGVMFGATNGKVDLPITKLRSDSKSLFQESPEEVWKRFESKILAASEAWKQGVFDPVPKFDEDCRSCMARDLCGVARKTILDSPGSSESGGVSE